MYRNDGVVVLIENIVFKFIFEKEVFLAKKKRSMDIPGKGVLHFHHKTPSLISNQTYRRTNMFLPY